MWGSSKVFFKAGRIKAYSDDSGYDLRRGQ